MNGPGDDNATAPFQVGGGPLADVPGLELVRIRLAVLDQLHPTEITEPPDVREDDLARRLPRLAAALDVPAEFRVLCDGMRTLVAAVVGRVVLLVVVGVPLAVRLAFQPALRRLRLFGIQARLLRLQTARQPDEAIMSFGG